MAKTNNLYSKSDMNANKDKKGYLGKNARIKAQNFRGEKSYGLWTELDMVAWTGVDLDSLEEGFTFTHLNGEEVCKKYINPATLRHAGKNRAKDKNNLATRIRQRFSQLKEHFDIKQLRYEIGRIPEGSILYITEKAHGTSGRTGNVYAELPLTRGKAAWNKLLGWTGARFTPEMEYQVVSGTRRVVLNPDQKTDGGYYSGNTFRIDIHNQFKELGVGKGLTFYYEICGYTETGGALMPPQPVEKIGDKKLRKLVKKKYGDVITYSYGCNPDTEPANQRYKVFVYRITVTLNDGKIFEVPWPWVRYYCSQLGLETVPHLFGPYIYKDASWDGQDELLEIVEKYLDQDSTIDPRHIIEGVCVRVEPPAGETYILKDKGHLFKILEGIIKDDPDIVDTEEAESYLEEADDLAATGEENGSN